MKMWKKSSVMTLLVFVFISLFVMTAAAKDGVITILAVNDLHSQLESQKVKRLGMEVQTGGFSALGALIEGERKHNPNLLLVETGDISYGAMFYHFKGEPEYRALSLMGVNVGTLGNHEFDHGADALKTTMQFAKFPVVVSNLSFEDPALAKLFPKSVIKETAGLKVGFFGLMAPELFSIASPGEKVKINQDIEGVARKMVESLKKQGADVIIALTHIGAEADMRLAENVAGIHAILGGHSHTLIPVKTVVNGPEGWKTLVGQQLAYTQYLGRLDLALKNGALDVPNTSWKTILVTPEAGEHSQIAKLTEDYTSRFDKALGAPIGSFLSDANATKAVARGAECPLGSFMAEAFRWKVKADIGVINGGNVRGDKIYPAGPVSYKTILEISPYGNKLTRVYLTGEQLMELAEISASALSVKGDNYDAKKRVPSGGFLHFAGMKVVFDSAKSPMEIDNDGKILKQGKRVKSVLVEQDGQWKPVDPKKVYNVVTSNWTADGGDKTVVMRNAVKKEATEILDADAIAEYLAFLGGKVRFENQNRIVIE